MSQTRAGKGWTSEDLNKSELKRTESERSAQVQPSSHVANKYTSTDASRRAGLLASSADLMPALSPLKAADTSTSTHKQSLRPHQRFCLSSCFLRKSGSVCNQRPCDTQGTVANHIPYRPVSHGFTRPTIFNIHQSIRARPYHPTGSVCLDSELSQPVTFVACLSGSRIRMSASIAPRGATGPYRLHECEDLFSARDQYQSCSSSDEDDYIKNLHETFF